MNAVQMVSITKKFPPSTIALDDVTFSVDKGEIHCLLGENGAGKTTLMNILYGLYKPDKGDIFLGGERVKVDSPKDAISLGIGMVHQHFLLVRQHTVAENIALGLSSAKFIFPLRIVKEKIEEFSKRYGLDVTPDTKIWQLSAGEQQRVEILKVLFRNARVLILDEPTTILTLQETENLFSALRRMATEGNTIIFITHKLDEVMAASSRVSVLRKGKLVETIETAKTNKQELASMMVGREVLFKLEKPAIQPSKIVLEIKELSALNDVGMLALKNVSFFVRDSEILGLAGVAGNGQSELIEVIAGLRKATSGKVFILGKDVTNRAPKEISDMGVAHIPEDRIRIGIVSDMSVADNLILKEYRTRPFSKRIFLEKGEVRKHANEIVQRYNIITPNIDTPAKSLSGGNIQRLILGREFHIRPQSIIASHPTYGLDVAATEQIRQLLLEQRNRGAAILLVSEDLEEIFSISDRVAVMYEGSILNVVETEKTKIEEVGMMMAGVKGEKAIDEENVVDEGKKERTINES